MKINKKLNKNINNSIKEDEDEFMAEVNDDNFQ